METAGGRDEPLTLLDLVAAVRTVAGSERDVVQIVRQLLDAGCVRRVANCKEIQLEVSQEPPTGAAA
jgi:hypothetical protein